jgi:hypothetical protein
LLTKVDKFQKFATNSRASSSKISSYKKEPRNAAIKLGIIQMNKGLQVSYCDAGSWVAI